MYIKTLISILLASLSLSGCGTVTILQDSNIKSTKNHQIALNNSLWGTTIDHSIKAQHLCPKGERWASITLTQNPKNVLLQTLTLGYQNALTVKYTCQRASRWNKFFKNRKTPLKKQFRNPNIPSKPRKTIIDPAGGW
jgi:hypothetical protein